MTKPKPAGRITLTQAAGDDMPVVEVYGYIGDDWDGITAEQFRREVMAIDAPEFELRINSGGGSVFQGIDIYNMITQHPATVHGVVSGVCASIATVILQACDTRRMPNNSHLMLHSTIGGVYGHATDVEDYLKLMRNSDEITKRIYATRSGSEMAVIEELLSRDSWLTADQALEYGLIDEVVDAIKTQPHVTPENFAAPARTSRLDRQSLTRAQQTLAAVAAHLPPGASPVASDQPKPDQPKPSPSATPQQSTPPESPAAKVSDSPAASTPQVPEQPAKPAPAAPAANSDTPPPITEPANVIGRHDAAEIAKICNAFGLQNRCHEFLAAGNTPDQVRKYAVDQQIASRALTPALSGDDPAPKPKKTDDPKAKFEAEYDEQSGLYQTQGITKEQYVRTRMVDEGLEPLNTLSNFANRQPAAA